MFKDGGLRVRCRDESCLSAHVESCLGSELMAAVSSVCTMGNAECCPHQSMSVELEFLSNISVSRPSNLAGAQFPMTKKGCVSSVDQFVSG